MSGDKNPATEYEGGSTRYGWKIGGGRVLKVNMGQYMYQIRCKLRHKVLGSEA